MARCRYHLWQSYSIDGCQVHVLFFSTFACLLRFEHRKELMASFGGVDRSKGLPDEQVDHRTIHRFVVCPRMLSSNVSAQVPSDHLPIGVVLHLQASFLLASSFSPSCSFPSPSPADDISLSRKEELKTRWTKLQVRVRSLRTLGLD